MKIEIFYLKCCSPNFLLLAPKAVPYTISTNISRYKTAFSKIAKNIFVRISKSYCKQCSIDIKTSSWAKHNQYQYSSNATQCVVHTINTNIDPNHILIGLAGRLYWWGWEGWWYYQCQYIWWFSYLYIDSIAVSLFEDILEEFDKSDIFAKYIGCELVLIL